jgi:type IV pilus assembly protein PilW
MKTFNRYRPLILSGLRKDERGFTLIELLVGLVLSLLAIIAIYQVIAVWDGRRRSVTSGSNAQISGSIGIFEIDRELQLAGMGIGNVTTGTTTASIGCAVDAYNTSFTPAAYTFTLAPIEIIDAASGAPDTLRVLHGDSAFVSSIQKFNTSTLTQKSLQYSAGFNLGDILLTAGMVSGNKKCELFEVTAKADRIIDHGTGNYSNFYSATTVAATMNQANAVNAFASGEVYNLGPGARRTEWSVTTAGVLTRKNTLRETQTFEVTEGIVNLQAQYGVDADNNGQIASGEWTNTVPTDWAKVLAVRVAVLARSSQLENELEDTANPGVKKHVTNSAPSWAAGAFTMRNIDGTTGTASSPANDWRNYRYRVYEVVVPLRNMIWGAKS